MKRFEQTDALLREMYQDEYYPNGLVDKIKEELQTVIALLETGVTDTETIQNGLDKAVCAINDLQEEFEENDSELETVARESIGDAVCDILNWFEIPIELEDALRERDW